MTCPKLPYELLDALWGLPDGSSLWVGETACASTAMDDDAAREVASIIRLHAKRLGGRLTSAWAATCVGHTRYEIHVAPYEADLGGLMWNDDIGRMPALHVETPVDVAFPSRLDHAEAVGDPTVLYPLLFADQARRIGDFVDGLDLVPILSPERHTLIGRLPLKERIS